MSWIDGVNNAIRQLEDKINRKIENENILLREENKILKIEIEKLKSENLTKEDIVKIFEELQESKSIKDSIESKEEDPFGIYSK
jgi:hypothetical protein